MDRKRRIKFDTSSLQDGVFLFALILSAHYKLPTPINDLSVSLQTLMIGLIASFIPFKRATLIISIYILLGALGLDVFSAVVEGFQFYRHPYAGFLLGFLSSPLLVQKIITSRKQCLQDYFMVFLAMHGIILFFGLITMEYPRFGGSSVFPVLTALLPPAVFKSILLMLIVWVSDRFNRPSYLKH